MFTFFYGPIRWTSCKALWATTSFSECKAYWRLHKYYFKLSFWKSFSTFFFSDKWETMSDPSFPCSHLKKDSNYEIYIKLFKYPIVKVQKSGMSYCFKSGQYVFLMTTLVRDNISRMHFSSETLVRMCSVQHFVFGWC